MASNRIISTDSGGVRPNYHFHSGGDIDKRDLTSTSWSATERPPIVEPDGCRVAARCSWKRCVRRSAYHSVERIADEHKIGSLDEQEIARR